MIDRDVLAAQHLPIAAALICAVTDGDPDQVEAVLTQRGVDLYALAVVLASLVPDDVVIGSAPMPSFDDMVSTACRILNTDPGVVLSASMDRQAAKTRHVICAAAHRSGLNYSEIGRRLHRDHSSIMHAVAKVNSDAYLSALASVVAGIVEDEDAA